MEKKQAISIAAVLIALAVAISILVFWPSPNLVVEGVLIDSGNKDPFELFAGFSENDVFLVSPQMNERAKSVDHQMFNAAALFLQVFEGNGKKTVQVLRVYNEENDLIYCLTNYGDVNTSETLDTGTCLEYLRPENGGLVLIEFPDPNLPSPVLEIGLNSLAVKPKVIGDIGTDSFLALRAMFENSLEIVERSNTILQRVSP